MFGNYLVQNDTRCRKALVVGIGGGNDMFSASLVVAHLLAIGMEVDVAGVLSPMAVHTFKGKIESPVNRIQGVVERFIHAPQPVRIPFVDAHVKRFYSAAGLGVGKCFDFWHWFPIRLVFLCISSVYRPSNS